LLSVAYGLGDSQAHAVSLAAALFGGYNAARVGFLADLDLHSSLVPHVILVFAETAWDYVAQQ